MKLFELEKLFQKKLGIVENWCDDVIVWNLVFFSCLDIFFKCKILLDMGSKCAF